MTKLSHRFFIALVALCMVAGENLAKYKLKNNKKLKETFNKLLETVTSVNEERLDALKKFYELQNHLPKVGIGRTDEKMVAVIIPNNELHTKENSREDFNNKGPNTDPDRTPATLKILKGTNQNVDDENTKMVVSNDADVSDTSSFLRGWKGCNKSAARTCKKACKRAYKEVCDDYRCSKSMKRSFKKACKRTCNSQFSNDNNSDDDYY